MRVNDLFYIDGRWTPPEPAATLEVLNPATEQISGRIGAGSARDVDKAVAAARAAFPGFATTPLQYRIDLLRRILAVYQARQSELGAAIRLEMGAPSWLADGFQTLLGSIHLEQTIAALEQLQQEQPRGTSRLIHEPIGVCGLITPWNWPMNQVVSKVAPALAAGCTVILKPSELAPYSSHVFAEIMHEAGVPNGVFNMINGTGPQVGAALASHSDIDLISFTGSTRAGIEVARAAAPTVKRVLQELGGKSANIILADSDLETAVRGGVDAVMLNSGQTCNAPTRMLVPRHLASDAAEIARQAAEAWTVGDPESEVKMGPIANRAQWQKVQTMIDAGVAEGATLASGGAGRPAGLSTGFYAKPTVFTEVSPDMRIAREEIFGPVLIMIACDDDDHAVSIANDSEYGLAGYVSGTDVERCRSIARRLRAGQIFINGADNDFTMPFGGYKRSGNGREWGAHGLMEYFEVKAIMGYDSNPT